MVIVSTLGSSTMGRLINFVVVKALFVIHRQNASRRGATGHRVSRHVRVVRVAAAFPVAAVGGVVRQVDRGDPLDPLVPEFVLRDELVALLASWRIVINQKATS
jgi:hypothetical protein